MVPMEQALRGAHKFVDEELVGRLTGGKRWLFGAAVDATFAEPGGIIKLLKDNTVVQMLGLMDEDNRLDVEKAYRYIKPRAAKGPAVIPIPFAGDLTLTESDVDKIYRYMMGG